MTSSFVSLFLCSNILYYVVWFKKLLNKLVKKSLSNPAGIYLFNVKMEMFEICLKFRGVLAFGC